MKYFHSILSIHVVPFLFTGVCYGSTTDTENHPQLQLSTKDLLEMSLEDLMQVKIVTIATGRQQTIHEAPAITSVITAQEIKDMGAQNLTQALETVVGLHVMKSPFGGWPLYVIRGLLSLSNAEVLFMVNGIPLKDLQYGNRGLGNGEWPVANIARIEVIRGPGSAIYGADAFAGVINVITKTKAEIEGTETGLRLGSFNTKEAWALHGGQWAGFDIAASLQYLKSDGYRPLIETDIQTTYDQQFGTHASLAPGKANLTGDFLGTQIELSRANWRWRIGYEKRDKLGMGVSNTLDSQGRLDNHLFHTELIYHQAELTPNWDVTAQVSFQNLANRGTYYLFPPLAFGGAYPLGMIAYNGTSETHTRVDVYGFYSGWRQHRLRVGIGYEYANLYKEVEAGNYGVDATGRPLPPGSPLVEVSDTPFATLPEKYRQVGYLSVQDEWQLSPVLTLTTGLRYDDYSDFGRTLNPRLALVWQTRPDLTTKLLYGRAFRAPSFNEFYLTDPQVQGNSHLRPETINTWELAFDYATTSHLQWTTNLFYYRAVDKISYTRSPDNVLKSENVGKWEGYGLELEAHWQVNKTVSMLANYSYQRTTNMDSHDDIGHYPQQAAYLQADWLLRPDWHVNLSTNWIADRQRNDGDTRPAVADYTTMDLTLQYRSKEKKGIELGVGINNLFDTDAREPFSKLTVPNDWPLAGRSLWGEVKYRF